jgi:hypothetical protein
MGSSGTMGNAIHLVRNNFYDNATGVVVDSFYAGGHPGFPQDSAVFERNRIYSNNFNIYGPKSDVTSVTPVPIGVGILIAGGDDNSVRDNQIFDNWRRGAMLIAVPDAISCAPSVDTKIPACTPRGASTTSTGNHYTGNVMSRDGGTPKPNGVDFWWDQFPTNSGNCFYPNTGSDGTPNSITGDPAPPPNPGTNSTGSLPENCTPDQAGTGTGDPAKEAMLFSCAGNSDAGNYDPTTCDWFQEPARPGTQAAARQNAQNRATSESLIGRVGIPNACTLLGGEGGTLTCTPFQRRT